MDELPVNRRRVRWTCDCLQSTTCCSAPTTSVTFRVLRKDRGFTTPAVITVAFGIGVATTIFSVVNQVLIEPLSWREPDRLVLVRERIRQVTPELRLPVAVVSDTLWRTRKRNPHESLAPGSDSSVGRDVPWFLDELDRRVRAIPGVLAVGAANHPPMRGSNGQRLFTPDNDAVLRSQRPRTALRRECASPSRSSSLNRRPRFKETPSAC